MTGLRAGQLADLVDRVQEVVGPWEDPPVGRPHVLPLPAAVVAVLFGLRHNTPDEVLAKVFGCSQATITRYHEILQPILRWVTRPEVDEQLQWAGRGGVLVDGFVAPVGTRALCRAVFRQETRVRAERCTCRKCHPGSSGGMFVLVRDAAEAVTSMDVQVGEAVRVGDRFG
jgi:hypothetical protein